MSRRRKTIRIPLFAAIVIVLLDSSWFAAAQAEPFQGTLTAAIEPKDGFYSLATRGGTASLNGAGIAAEVDHKWLHAGDYGKPVVVEASEAGELGRAHTWKVTYGASPDLPELIYRLRVYADVPFADLQVTVRNSTSREIAVEDIRPIEITTAGGIELGGSPADDRVLSDSLSEDRPTMRIRDFADAPDGTHRGFGSQLVFNRGTGNSYFVGALTSDKFLSIFRLHTAPGGQRIASYEADDTGTTELIKDFSLSGSPAKDQIALSVKVEPGKELESERLLLSLDSDYHRQLETYAHLIRDLHRARVTAPTPMGWWSWTAYYAKLDEAKALIDAQWLSKHLEPMGYNFFHIDEGYSIGRGDYLAADTKLFPDGMEAVEKKIAGLRLVPAIWTAPFEVSDRSWVYKNHPEWLVKNAEGAPIRLAGTDPPNHDRIYVLDATQPGAQEYLKKTYSTMTKQWGIRSIKLDFMEDTAIEGEHYRPETSALEAQRIGLSVIRAAVGDNVYLDKDGSEMLNPVGLVDMGRISQDTAHNFRALKESATGIAARYYMNRNFFISDPDAFMVTAGEGKDTLSLDEAKVSIALAAVSGGMFEIGDILLTLDAQPDRLELIENKELISIARDGKASIPVDLMSYRPEDGQPSLFVLHRTQSESILTVFNWTDMDRAHELALGTLGLNPDGTYTIESVLEAKDRTRCHPCSLSINLRPHDVQMFKITEVLPSH